MTQDEGGIKRKVIHFLTRRDFLKLAVGIGIASIIFGSGYFFLKYINSTKETKPKNQEDFFRNDQVSAWINKLVNLSKKITISEQNQTDDFFWEPIAPVSQLQIETKDDLSPNQRPFKNLPENSVFVYFPGAEEKEISQIIMDKEILDWYYHFLIAKKIDPEKAKKQVISFAKQVLAIETSNDEMEIKKAKALKLMDEFGFYFLPWGWFDPEKQLPQTMVQAIVSLLENHLRGKPVFFAGYSLGGLSQRIIINGLQKDNLKINPELVGAVFLSEGYFGDNLAYILYGFKDDIGGLVKQTDEETGNYLIDEYPKIKNKWWWRFLIEPLGLETTIDGFVEGFKQEPKALGRIVRLVHGSLYHPDYLVGLKGNRSRFSLVSIRSLKDPHSIFSVIPGGLEFVINKKIFFRKSKFSFPLGFDLSTHRKFPELAFYCFDRP